MKHPIFGVAALQFLLFVSSCALSPGMKLDVDPDEEVLEEKHEVDGHTVNLKIIGPELFKKYPELSTTVSVAPTKDVFTKPDVEYVLGPYDVVMVQVWDHPELSQSVGLDLSDKAAGQIISQRGTMYYPYAGEIVVAGLTLAELRATLSQKIGVYLRSPQVDVRVLNYRSQKVYVGGAVETPTAVFISDEPLSLPDAIAQAGGMTDKADGSNIYLVRDSKTYRFDLMDMYRSGIPLEKVYLKNGDKINVMSQEENKIYVLGAVSSQKALPLLHGRLSLSQALMESGIDQNKANTESVYVIRAAEDGSITMYHLNALSPIALVMGENFKMSPRDIVYVDTHGLVEWNKVISLLLPTAALINTATSLNDNLFLIRNGIENEMK